MASREFEKVVVHWNKGLTQEENYSLLGREDDELVTSELELEEEIPPPV